MAQQTAYKPGGQVDGFLLGHLRLRGLRFGCIVAHDHSWASASHIDQGKVVAAQVAHDSVILLPLPLTWRHIQIILVGQRQFLEFLGFNAPYGIGIMHTQAYAQVFAIKARGHCPTSR